MVNVVIIGLGAGGFGAALAAKKNRAEVSIIDNKSFDLLHQCGLPFALEGKLAFSGLEHPIHAEKMGIKIVRGKVEKIDAGAKHVFIGKDAVKYDKLIIATGSKPFVAPIKTSNKIYTVHNDRDTQELEKNIVEGGKAIVVGAGAIGLETAVALKKKGMDVKVVDMLASTFPKAIDKDMSEIIEAKLMEKGIKLELGKRIDSIEEKAIVVMATGVKPNVDFLEGSMVEINVSGIVVDDKMQTTVKDIYAAGDCCGVKSLINGQRWNSILANNAYKEGMVAGANAAGGSLTYKGILGTFVSVVDDIEVAATGFNGFFAEKYGIKMIVGKAKGKNRPEWFGPAKELVVKVIADDKGKVIGGQAVGSGAKERVNIISTAIKAGMGLKELSELELAYCPAVSDYYDVLVMAAEIGMRKIK